MAKRYEDKEYLNGLLGQALYVVQGGFYAHSSQIQAHHLLKPASD